MIVVGYKVILKANTITKPNEDWQQLHNRQHVNAINEGCVRAANPSAVSIENVPLYRSRLASLIVAHRGV